MKKQEDAESCGGMCPGCGVEEAVPCKIRIWEEEKDELFFACVLKLDRGGCYG